MFKTNKRAIACMALNYAGSLLAVASIRGTKIKIFNTKTSEKLQELRRGSKNAEILHIIFHRSSMFLACTSNKDAVHIFELFDSIKIIDESEYRDLEKTTPPDEIGYRDNEVVLNPAVRNHAATLAAVGSLISNYFQSHWSLSRLKLNDAGKVCAFADANNFIGTPPSYFVVVTVAGKIYLYEIPKDGGYCVLKSTHPIEATDGSLYIV
eukprot:TRINITY_DN3593_c0_g1_i30.p1 TRINITY_DN3593_c0_g1~~TRINITY_DN3593_c0_g1_i30.p1  ORF type:complete len:209 (+),score=32.04 TRINITY_DN3593_c0_g1_i30:113-739(+)